MKKMIILLLKSFSRFFCILLFLSHAVLYAGKSKKWGQLSAEEKSTVQFVVEYLFFHNDFAYTLCFDKPVSLERIGFRDYCQLEACNMPFTPGIWGQFLCKGLTILDEQLLDRPLKSYVLLIGQHDPYLQTQDVIFIHKESFLHMVSNNLPIFKEKLGAHITGKSLLAAIEDRKETFMSLINYDDELLGLLSNTSVWPQEIIY